MSSRGGTAAGSGDVSMFNFRSQTGTALLSQSSSTSASSQLSILTGHRDCLLTLRHSVPFDRMKPADIECIRRNLKVACQDLGCNVTHFTDIYTEAYSVNECDITVQISGDQVGIINQKLSELAAHISSYSDSCTTLVTSGNQFLARAAQLKELLQLKDIHIFPPFGKVRKQGIGTVYKCQYRNSLRPRALKVVQVPKIDLSKQGTIFCDEGTLLDFCGSCPHVVQFYGSFVLDEVGSSDITTKVFIMEWMEHGDLSDLLVSVSKSQETNRVYITPQLFMRFASQILEVLHFLHTKKPGKNSILHRELKPENILVDCISDEFVLSNVTLKLSGFDFSKEVNSEERDNSMGVVAGNSAYQCPECSEPGHTSCPADDTWSAALVLVELLCGFSVWLPGKNIIEWSIPMGPIGTSHVSKVNADKVLENCHPWLKAFVEPVMCALRPQPQLRCSEPKQLLHSLQKCYELRDFIHDVFICHDLEHVDLAQRLEDELSKSGLKVYRASIGREIYSWCEELLSQTFKIVGLYLEQVLKSVHFKVFDALQLSKDDIRMLESETRYKGGKNSEDLPADAPDLLAVIHRRIAQQVLKYTKLLGKVENSDMTKIASKDGCFQLGKFCYPGSMRGHENATKIVDCDIEFVFGLLRNIKDVPVIIQSAAEKCFRLRHHVIKHYQLKLSGQCDSRTFFEVSHACMKMTESLQKQSSESKCFDDHIAFVQNFHRDKESRIMDHLASSTSILLQSRFFVPIISDKFSDSAEQWMKRTSSLCQYPDVILHCSIAFAGIQVSQSCKSFFSRLSHILPVNCSSSSAHSKLPAIRSAASSTRCFIPDGLFRSVSSLLSVDSSEKKLFHYLLSRPVSEICAQLESCTVTVCAMNTHEAMADLSDFSARFFSSFKQLVSHKRSRFKIIERFETLAQNVDGAGSQLCSSPSENIVRVIVQKIPDNEDPHEGMMLHSSEHSEKNVGLVLWVKQVEDQAGTKSGRFFIDILTMSDSSFIKKSVMCCSCTTSREENSDFQVFEHVLRNYAVELTRLVQQIVEYSTVEDDERVLPSLFARIEAVQIDQYRLHDRFQGISDVEILQWHRRQCDLFSCQSSIQRSLQRISSDLVDIEPIVAKLRRRDFEKFLQKCCAAFERSRGEIETIITRIDTGTVVGWLDRRDELQQFLDNICVKVQMSCDPPVPDLKSEMSRFEYYPEFRRLIKMFQILSRADSYNPVEGILNDLKRWQSLFDAIICKFDREKATFMQIQLEVPPCVDVLMKYHIKKEAAVLELLRTHSFTESLPEIVKKFNENHWIKANVPEWIMDIKNIFSPSGPIHRDAIEAITVEIEFVNVAIQCEQKNGDQMAQMELGRLVELKRCLVGKLKEANMVVSQRTSHWIPAIRDFKRVVAMQSAAAREAKAHELVVRADFDSCTALQSLEQLVTTTTAGTSEFQVSCARMPLVPPFRMYGSSRFDDVMRQVVTVADTFETVPDSERPQQFGEPAIAAGFEAEQPNVPNILPLDALRSMSPPEALGAEVAAALTQEAEVKLQASLQASLQAPEAKSADEANVFVLSPSLDSLHDDCKILKQILLELGLTEHLDIFRGQFDSDATLASLSTTMHRKIIHIYKIPDHLAASFCEKCRIASKPVDLDCKHDSAHGQNLWLKGILALESCIKGSKPFVSCVMKKLHHRVLKEVKEGVTRDLGLRDDEEEFDFNWNCGLCVHAVQTECIEDSTVSFDVCALDVNGVADCKTPHNLIPFVLHSCYLKNIPSGLFPEFHETVSNVPLLLCRNPGDPADTLTCKSSRILFLRNVICESDPPHLIPFCVKCTTRDLHMHVVMCLSHASHTQKLVTAHLSSPENLPEPRGAVIFGFWTLLKNEDDDNFTEAKHAFKLGDIVQFDGNHLPHGIIKECRYLVARITPFCFNVCVIVCPASQMSADQPPLVVIRRSPVGRIRDAALVYHSRKFKVGEICWRRIRTDRLSSTDHGEFSKLFCSQTSREVDFCDPCGTNSGEQLFNVISLCTAFKFELFCELFNVHPDKKADLQKALNDIKIAAGISQSRNKLAHNLLLIGTKDYSELISQVSKILQIICNIIACVSDTVNSELTESALSALAEIKSLEHRFVQISTLTDRENQAVDEQRQQLMEDRDRLQEQNDILRKKHMRKFDSFGPLLKSDIQHQLLQPGNKIREGTQGAVYKVNYSGQNLAVKIFKENEIGEAWRQELNSLTVVTHMNIVRIHNIVYESLDDKAQLRRALGYAMELMARSAADQIQCSTKQLVSIFVQIAKALSHAHGVGVIHFDVKPDNILLDDSCMIAKLCDFGLARIEKSTFASMDSSKDSWPGGKCRGTVFYMAPEAYESTMTKLCDIYSFGRTMWQLLHPFRPLTPNIEKPVTADDCPEALKLLVTQCTLHEPSQRPQEMSEVLERLQAVLAAIH